MNNNPSGQSKFGFSVPPAESPPSPTMARPQEPRPAPDFARVVVRDGRVCVTPSDLRCVESFRCWEIGQRLWMESGVVPGIFASDELPRPSGQSVVPIRPDIGTSQPRATAEESVCLALYRQWRRGRDQWELMAATSTGGSTSPFEPRPSGQVSPTATPRASVATDLETFECVERGRALVTWVEANDRDRAGRGSSISPPPPDPRGETLRPEPVGPWTGMDWSEGYSVMQKPTTSSPKFPVFQPGGQAAPPGAPTDAGLPEWAKYLIGGVVGAAAGFGAAKLMSSEPRRSRMIAQGGRRQS